MTVYLFILVIMTITEYYICMHVQRGERSSCNKAVKAVLVVEQVERKQSNLKWSVIIPLHRGPCYKQFAVTAVELL